MTEDPQKKYEDLVRRARQQFESGTGDTTDAESRRSATHATKHRTPKQVGPYRIIDVLGSGGMGVVYLAEQEEPIRRRVALKLIKLGMDTAQVLARFEAERHALALMNHPNIAKVLDAGTSEDGRPYFVMEYVAGERVTSYCDRDQLDMTERLGVFIQICNGVQHAHQKGVMHRDIKPSNVLVAMHDDKPVPKIIDFGVAKAIGRELTEQTLFTEQGQIVGTPEYMSPEQAGATDTGVDTRSDVYSLGVLLYELLAGALPFDSKNLRRAGYAEIQRIIREEEPPKPSTRLSGLGEESETIAERRRSDPRRLSQQIRGDLDWITLRAIEKDAGRRYATVAALAEDIARHLRNEPVAAGPPSASYRLAKFVRRNRGPFVLGVTLAIALVAIASISTVAFITTENARQSEKLARLNAERNERTVREVTDTLLDLFKRGKPGGALEDATLAEALVAFTEEKLAKLSSAEAVRAELLDALGTVHYEYTRYESAAGLFKEALALRQEVFGTDDWHTYSTMSNLALTLEKLGQPEEALPMHDEALAGLRRLLGPNHKETVAALNNLGTLHQRAGRFGMALPLLREASEGFRNTLGFEHVSTMSATGNFAYVTRALGRDAEAMKLYEGVFEVQKRTLPPGHPGLLNTTFSLVTLKLKLGQLLEAEALLKACPYADPNNLSNPPVFTGALLKALADLRVAQNRLAEAKPYYRLVIPMFADVNNMSMLTDARLRLAPVSIQKNENDGFSESEEQLLAVIDTLENVDTPLAKTNLTSATGLLRSLYGPERMDEPEKLKVLESRLEGAVPSQIRSAGD